MAPTAKARPPSRPSRKESLTAIQMHALQTGNITRTLDLPDYVTNDRQTRNFGWVLGSLWKKVEGLGAFSSESHPGDGAFIPLLDTAVVSAGSLQSFLYTQSSGAKKGYVERRQGVTFKDLEEEVRQRDGERVATKGGEASTPPRSPPCNHSTNPTQTPTTLNSSAPSSSLSTLPCSSSVT